MSEALEMARALVKMLEEKEAMENVEVTEKPFGVKLGLLNSGDKFENELGRFIILEQNEGTGTTLVIQENLYKKNFKFGNSCDYKDSDLRRLCEGEITEAYEKVFDDALVEHDVVLKSVDNQDYGTIICKVRPLTFDEAREFNDLLVNKELPDWWWTCSAWSTKDRGWEYSEAVVLPSGNFDFGNYGFDGGVRPFCILKSNLFVSKVEE